MWSATEQMKFQIVNSLKWSNFQIVMLASVRNVLPANTYTMTNDEQLEHTNVTMDG